MLGLRPSFQTLKVFILASGSCSTCVQCAHDCSGHSMGLQAGALLSRDDDLDTGGLAPGLSDGAHGFPHYFAQAFLVRLSVS